MAQKLVRFISLEEFKRVLKEEKDKKFRLAYILAFGSGLRISEIVGYKRTFQKKVDGELKTCVTEYPPLTADRVELEKHQIRITGKGEKERITVTSPWLNKSMLRFLPLKIPRRTLQGRFSRLTKKVLGRNISFHVLRHGFANLMANEKNIPLPMLQIMLGHSRLDTTGIYTASNPVRAIERAWNSYSD